MKSHINKGNLKTSKGFVRFEYQDDGKSRKLQLIETPMTSSEIILYIESKLKKFIQHSNDSKGDYLFWKRWNTETDLSVNAILTVDFSENLSLPIWKKPQTMYWVRKQISLHCGVGMIQEGEDVQKIYFGHVSEDREHDQPCTALSIDDALTVLPVSDTLFFRSDNASNFKSSQAFYDVQELANKWNINIVRVFGAAGHGKGEVDSCGGHLKNPVRKQRATISDQQMQVI